MKLLLAFLLACTVSAVAGDDETLSAEEVVAGLFAEASGHAAPTVPSLIAGHGYRVETHHVVTEDGYILGVHRLPGPYRGPFARPKPVVLLMHGLLSSSADWVITGPGKGLAYILSDAGYDVWMGNARGNTWSKNHTRNMSEREFWSFSWHEIGYYDLPAIIDYALATTKQKNLIYVGHSQGTTSFYVMTTTRPEYNNKIKAMFSLAPVAYMGHLFSPLPRLLSRQVRSLTAFFSLVGYHEFLPSDDTIDSWSNQFCDDDQLSQLVCKNVIFLLCGFNKAQMNTTMLPAILEYAPAGASTLQLAHYGQEIRSKKFRQFDFGRIRNLLTYGSLSPPDYDLSKVTAPVHLLYSDNDWFAAVRDVRQLYDELGNGIEMYRIPDPRWNHVDFIWGIDAKEYVYDIILDRLRNLYR